MKIKSNLLVRKVTNLHIFVSYKQAEETIQRQNERKIFVA